MTAFILRHVGEWFYTFILLACLVESRIYMFDKVWKIFFTVFITIFICIFIGSFVFVVFCKTHSTYRYETILGIVDKKESYFYYIGSGVSRRIYEVTLLLPDSEEITLRSPSLYHACEVGYEVQIDVKYEYLYDRLVHTEYVYVKNLYPNEV